MHIRDKSVPHGGITVAYEKVENTIIFSMAICHEKDNYHKHLGRCKAAGRMQSKRFQGVFNGTEKEFREAAHKNLDGYKWGADKLPRNLSELSEIKNMAD